MSSLPEPTPRHPRDRFSKEVAVNAPVYRFRIYADASTVTDAFWTFVKTIECTEAEIHSVMVGWDYELKGLQATALTSPENRRKYGHMPTVQVRVFGPLDPSRPPAVDLKSLVAPPKELNP